MIGVPASSRGNNPMGAMVVSPGAFATNVKVKTEPLPVTPPEPGGRVAVICNFPPAESSRCTMATAWPSLERKPPLEMFASCSSLGSYCSCTLKECICCGLLSSRFTAKVCPFAGFVLAGSKLNIARSGAAVDEVFAGCPGAVAGWFAATVAGGAVWLAPCGCCGAGAPCCGCDCCWGAGGCGCGACGFEAERRSSMLLPLPTPNPLEFQPVT